MGRIFTLIIFFVLSSNHTIAQDSIIEHSIQKGESVYVISKKYGVSMNAIFELNPGSRNVIYAGSILRVPKSDTSSAITDTKISNYEVLRGDTKSGLSRRFDVSIAQLEQQNPHIVRMLQVGHRINLDKTIKELESQLNVGEHRVLKGETLWGIARNYEISVNLLTATNANQLSEFLQIGQILTIPDKNAEIPISRQYIVKRGDTKFELSRRFNTTIKELEKKNPHIVNMLMTGQKLNVDSSESTLASVDTDDDHINSQENEDATDETITDTSTTDKTYIDYIIQPNETLFGLSRKAGMTIEEFISLNPKLLTAVNAGDIIKMPGGSNVTETSPEDSTAESITKANKNEELYSNLDTSITNGLYFFTPFNGDELSSLELRQKILNNNKDYEKYVEFFQGAQIAIDSALALNLNFDITLIKENDVKSKLKIESSFEKNALLVPFNKNDVQYPKIEANKTISVIDIESSLNQIENSIVYRAIPSENFQKRKTLNYLADKNAHVVVVSDLDQARNKDLILNTIPEAKFLKVDNAGFFNNNALENSLSKDLLNYVILDSKKTIVFLNSTTALMSKMSDYNIQLVIIDSSLIPEQSEVSDMRFRVLKLIFPAILNQNNFGSTNFENSYKKLFNTKPSRHAILGFDVTLDILLRLSQKSTFENSINNISSEHQHLKFNYKKTNDSNYSNTGIYLMQYNSNEGIVELE